MILIFAQFVKQLIVQDCQTCVFILSILRVQVLYFIDILRSGGNRVIIMISIDGEVDIVSDNSRSWWVDTLPEGRKLYLTFNLFFWHGWCFGVVDFLAWLMFWNGWCFVLFDVRAWLMFWHGRCLRFLRKYP